MENKKDVDIIIPIYNAFEYTKKCIETVIENTDLQTHHLVLINDKSPDEKILPMLEEFVESYKDLNIVLINNEDNLGFVKTVNKGMSYSKNDVVLLNSDTEVTKNWLEKIREVAYSRKFVATVTPLSNNATLASVPNFLEDNELPDFLGLEEYAKEIEECSMNINPELPTAHGFCMYITRQAIDEVGLFDDVTFEKGYGEENDFSYRCIKHGYVNLLCDNTFIYHKGTQSFSKDKEKMVLDHLKKLEKKHPVNYSKTDEYCKNYPTRYIQDNIKYSIDSKYRKNVLMLVHDFRDLQDKILGGTTLHIYDLIDKLRKYMNLNILYSDSRNIRLKTFFANSTSEINLGKIHTYSNMDFYNNEYKEMLKQITDIMNIDVIHIHHMLYQYLDIFDFAEEKNIPLVITLHDYYMVCPTIQLIHKNEEFCKTNDIKKCEECLQTVLHTEGNIIEKWQKEFGGALKKASKIIVPSNTVKEIVNKYYKDLNLDIKVIEHGVSNEIETYKSLNYIEENNIAFMGGINEYKGLDKLTGLKELVNSDKNTNNIKLHLFGGTNKEYLNESDKNYIYHGRYDREDIHRLLQENNIKLICILSTWAETYSYTLTEAMLSKIPVITFNIGATYERLKVIDGGWIIDLNSSIDSIFEKINNIFENDDDYKKKIENIEKYIDNIKTVDDMADEYKVIYEGYFKEKKEHIIPNRQLLKQILIDSNEILQANKAILEYHKAILEHRKVIDDLSNELQKVNDKYVGVISSRRWKMFENNFAIKLYKKLFK